MKYYYLLLALSLIAAALGFAVLAGTAAIIFRLLFVGFLISFAVALFRHKNIKRPVRGSFATSFRSESEQV